MKNIIALIGIIIVGYSSWILLNKDESKTNEKEVNIGVIAPMSGDSAEYGQKCEKAVSTAQLLFDNNKVNVIFEDTEANPKKGIFAVQKLIKQDKVIAIVGGILSSVTIPTAQLSQKNKVIQIATTASSPKITKLGDYIYRVWPSDEYEGTVMAKEAIKKYNRIAILYMNNDYGLSISDIFAKIFKQYGGKVELKEAYLKDENNFKRYLLKMKKLSIPAVYIAGYYKDTALIAKQAYEINFKPQFYGTTAVEDQKFIDIGQEAVNGFIYPIASKFNKNINGTAKLFYTMFKEKYSYEPGWVESHCFDASMIIFNAVNKANATSAKEIKRYIDSNNNFQGADGIIKFDKNGDVKSDMIIKTVDNGKFKRLVQ